MINGTVLLNVAGIVPVACDEILFVEEGHDATLSLEYLEGIRYTTFDTFMAPSTIQLRLRTRVALIFG